MYRIEQITTNSFQKQNLILPDGSSLSLTIYYVPLQYGWFVTELIYQGFTLKGMRIVNSPNMLHQFRNLLPFGFACFTQGNREPTQLEDFTSGASTLYLLSADEVAEYTRFLSGQV